MGSLLYELCGMKLFSTISLHELLSEEREFYWYLHTYWYEHTYMTPRWWLLVILSVVCPIVWWKLVEKQRITEVTSFGLFYGVAAILLDSIGSNALVWAYPVRLTPYIYPQLYPYDVGIVMIPFMLLYQYFGHHFKLFVVSTGILSAFLSFVAEVVMEVLGIYKEITWKHIYSFPVYWLLGLICWGILAYFKKLESRG
ncbi:CBO0543 family protein [Ectobacillus ponti]|uniref:Uncharacterized protein n=1 Tax=Ectobacillus ponti TaxID=2961894 RepID=A0AA42BRB2_9BACI|nr:CBO0543 family protein [Ectobacillus ponti]MCP8967228.1 hypothetical protein [Ectobacillus ponti]